MNMAIGSHWFPRIQEMKITAFRLSGSTPRAVLPLACRLAATGARLEVRMESLLLSCRALSSPTTCRFIPAHSGPWLPPWFPVVSRWFPRGCPWFPGQASIDHALDEDLIDRFKGVFTITEIPRSEEHTSE